jgi:two-component system nitrogen regulation response regulator GlnG
VPRIIMDKLLAYPWPGNVRELENCVERAVVMSPEDSVSLDVLPDEIRECTAASDTPSISEKNGDPDNALRQAVINLLNSRDDPAGVRNILLHTVEETLLRQLLESGRYSQRELAELLGLSRVTLRKKLEQFKLM